MYNSNHSKEPEGVFIQVNIMMKQLVNCIFKYIRSSGRATPTHDPQQKLVVMVLLLSHGAWRTTDNIFDLYDIFM